MLWFWQPLWYNSAVESGYGGRMGPDAVRQRSLKAMDDFQWGNSTPTVNAGREFS